MATRPVDKTKDVDDPLENESSEGARGHSPVGGGDADGTKKILKKKPGAKRRRAAKKTTTKSTKTAEPEVLNPEKSDEEDSVQSVVVDVNTGAAATAASLPSLPAPTTTTSMPALRGRTGGAARVDALDRFLSEMGKYPLLSTEEERDLTLRYYNHKEQVAARKLVVHNLRLVVKMAYKYRRAWANVLDLIQEGNVGLVEAVRRYDPFKGAKFSTYATFWIRAYMLRYLLEHSRTVRISRTRVGRKLFFQLSREREKLRALGIEPGPKLLAERLGVDQDDLEEVVRHMDQAEVRLDAPIHNDEASGGTVLDGLSAVAATPEAEAYKREFADDVSAALDSFAKTLTDEREKDAWANHLMTDDPKSLSELGKKYGVTKQRMGQIVAGIRKRLKTHLIDKLGPDVELGYYFEGE